MVNATDMPPDEQVYAYQCDDYLALPGDSQVWLIDKVVPVSGAVNIMGDSKVGKSFAAMQLASALTGASSEWFNFKVSNPGSVLYVQLDTPRPLWRERIAKVRKACNLDKVIFADRETLDTWPFDACNPEHIEKLRVTVDRFQPSVVILDTLRELHAKNENDSTDMKVVLSSLVTAVKPAALILISHTRKPNFEKGPDSITSAARGSNYIASRMDTIVRFTKKHLEYTGRSVEEGKLNIKRLENGLWSLGMNEWDVMVQEVIDDNSLTSEMAKAKELARMSGKKLEACRSAIRRAREEAKHA